MADLTLAERERLTKLNEELSESIERMGALIQAMGKANQAVCKALIHGYQASFEGIDYDNRDDIMREIGDVKAIIDLMVGFGDLNENRINAQRTIKRGRLAYFLRHQVIPASKQCDISPV